MLIFLGIKNSPMLSAASVPVEVKVTNVEAGRLTSKAMVAAWEGGIGNWEEGEGGIGNWEGGEGGIGNWEGAVSQMVLSKMLPKRRHQASQYIDFTFQDLEEGI